MGWLMECVARTQWSCHSCLRLVFISWIVDVAGNQLYRSGAPLCGYGRLSVTTSSQVVFHLKHHWRVSLTEYFHRCLLWDINKREGVSRSHALSCVHMARPSSDMAAILKLVLHCSRVHFHCLLSFTSVYLECTFEVPHFWISSEYLALHIWGLIIC